MAEVKNTGPTREGLASGLGMLQAADAESLVDGLHAELGRNRESHATLKNLEQRLLDADGAALAKAGLSRGATGTLTFLRGRAAVLAAAIEPLTKELEQEKAEINRDPELTRQGKEARLARVQAAHDEKLAKLIDEAAASVADLADTYAAGQREVLDRLLRERPASDADEARVEAATWLAETRHLAPELQVKSFIEHGLGASWAEPALRGLAYRLTGDESPAWPRLVVALAQAKHARAAALLNGTDPRSREVTAAVMKLALLKDAVEGFNRAKLFLRSNADAADLVRARKET